MESGSKKGCKISKKDCINLTNDDADWSIIVPSQCNAKLCFACTHEAKLHVVMLADGYVKARNRLRRHHT